MPTRPDTHIGSVVVENTRNDDEVIRIAARLDEAKTASAGTPLTIDFSRLHGRSQTVDPWWGTVFGSILASQYGDTPLRVDLPVDDAARRQLARAGVYFALARNRQFDWTSLDPVMKPLVRRWARDWQPAVVQQPLFDINEVHHGQETPVTLEPAVVAFLNPDRQRLADATEDQKAVIYPWLSGLIGQRTSGTSKLSVDLQQDISLVIWELLGNIRDHAKMRSRELCSLNLFVTDGGNGGRLYISVVDTGRGMPAALPHLKWDSATEPTAMVDAAFNGLLPRRERDRGRGLNRIKELVDRMSGQLFTATGPSADGAVVVDYRGGDETVASRHVPGLTVKGTVVMLRLPIPTDNRTVPAAPGLVAPPEETF